MAVDAGFIDLDLFGLPLCSWSKVPSKYFAELGRRFLNNQSPARLGGLLLRSDICFGASGNEVQLWLFARSDFIYPRSAPVRWMG
jgi:hypothetical protein